MKNHLSVLLTQALFLAVLACFSNVGQAQYAEDPIYAPPAGFYLDYIILFTDDVERSRLKIFASVIYDDLTFLKSENRFSAEYRATFSIIDEDGNYADSKRLNRNIFTENYFDTNSRNKFDRLEIDFDLPPGEYTVIFEFMDKDSRDSKRKEKKISIPRLDESDLLISGPILLDTTIVSEEGKIILKPGVSGDIFDGLNDIWVYFEVLSRNYPIDLEIDYHLIDSDGEDRITGNFTRSIKGPILRDRFPLAIKEFPFDNYRLLLVVRAGEYSAQNKRRFRIHWPGLPPAITNLDEAIDQLRYIASEREITRLKENYRGRRLEMFIKFWENWADDEIEGYKLMEEYYRRVWEAGQLFSEGGWKCDRGHVYLVHGPPSEIDRHPYDIYTKAYEIWYYLEDNKRFVFVDEGGFGDYKLKSPFWGN